MSRGRDGSGLLLASVLVAFALQLGPLPDTLAPFRPYWPALVLCYWLLEAPDRVGLGFAFFVGLIGDLLFGSLLGEQALRLTAMAFIVLRFRPRLRFFTLPQQALALLALMLNDRVMVLMVRGLSREGWPTWEFWIAPFIAMAMWPWLFVLLDDLRVRLRGRDGT